ncbi:MAG: hypothetical protein U0931_36455 [Vulcanimicrobiota bacterium]
MDLIVDFARENNKDGPALVLIARATPKVIPPRPPRPNPWLSHSS